MKVRSLTAVGIVFLSTAWAMAAPSHASGGYSRSFAPGRCQPAPGVTARSYRNTQTGQAHAGQNSGSYYYGAGRSGYGGFSGQSIDDGTDTDSRAPKGYVTRPSLQSSPALQGYSASDTIRR